MIGGLKTLFHIHFTTDSEGTRKFKHFIIWIIIFSRPFETLQKQLVSLLSSLPSGVTVGDK